MNMSRLKVALVYDRVNKWGGAERVLEALHEIWPEAPLYTAVYQPQGAPWAKKFRVVPSFLQRFPLAQSRHELYPFLMPLAFESFNFDQYQVVISITSEAAKGIITKPETLHFCYCLTPTRYLWSGYQTYFSHRLFRVLTRPVVAYLRQWDQIAAQRPDFYLAISKNVQKRIRKYYRRHSEVVYPPVAVDQFQVRQTKGRTIDQDSGFFLVVSRLVGYKKIEIAVKAFNQLKLPLKIVGVGSQLSKLKRLAGKKIEFLGQLTDSELLVYYQRCRAVIFPPEEDFGLVPLEAQACGKPVIAYRGGGALETVREGETGLFFSPQTAEALIAAVRRFERLKFDPEVCRRQAEKFSRERFQRKIKKLVEQAWLRKQ